jgi:alpha-glucan,water dikinase
VHAGADLEQCVRLLGSRLPPPTARAVETMRRAAASGDSDAAMEAAAEARQELRGSLQSLAGSRDISLLREMLFLDLALEDGSRRALESAQPTPDLAALARRVGVTAEHALLSSVGAEAEHLCFALLLWRRASAPGAGQPWALRQTAAADRLRCALAEAADDAGLRMQPFAEALGGACAVPAAAIRIFSEEVVRGGAGFALSLALTRLEPALRGAAQLGAWTVIAPADAVGRLRCVHDLAAVQAESYEEPTVLLAERVSGGEELPRGCVALLTPSSCDVLSHSAVRARNVHACFATCHDDALLRQLAEMQGSFVAVRLGGHDGLTVAPCEPPAEHAAAAAEAVVTQPRALPAARFSGKWALPLSAFAPGLVGGKSRNTRALRERLAAGDLPPDVQLPASLAVPFGAFEAALDDQANKGAKAALLLAASSADLSSQEAADATLAACRDAVRAVRCPAALRSAVLAEMAACGMPAVPSEPEAAFDDCFAALRDVWASKYNVRAVLSLRQAGLDHASLRMAVLVQRVVSADAAFVLHTANPTGDAGELYGELVLGLGETLVGNYPGRALAFAARKKADGSGCEQPRILGYPSKCRAMRVPPTFIFRSDSNGEDLEGYAGAGLYDSVMAQQPVLSLVDYSDERLFWDDGFALELLQRIADAGCAVERALGGPQDVEGCVASGAVHLVQTRPQV